MEETTLRNRIASAKGNMQRYFIYGKSLSFDELLQRLELLQDKVRRMV